MPSVRKAVIGIDLGGTKISGAIFDSTGHILYRELQYIEDKEGNRVAESIIELIDKLKGQSANLSINIKGVGVAIPGIYHAHKGTVWAPNIPGWQEYPLVYELSRNLADEIELIIDSDRACYIFGETWQGAAKGVNNAIFLAVGTGIGAGILCDGRLIRGNNDIAGAIGWMAVSESYQPEYSKVGCLEYHASGNGLARMANVINKNNRSYTTRDIFLRYHQNDPVAIQALDQAIACWGRAVANLVSIFNPEKIIFGGGVFGPGSQFIDTIYQEARKWSQPISIEKVKLEVSRLGEDAGLYGAGYLALQNSLK